MGNCVTRKGASGPGSCGFPEDETRGSTSSPTSLLKTREGCTPEAKKVRFRITDDMTADDGGAKKADNVMRLRIVVTTQELKRILKCNKISKKWSIEELLDVIDSQGRKITRIENGIEEKTGKAWKPLLASIPEAGDHQ